MTTRIHPLKTWPEFYEHVLTGAKPFEVRRDDRGFQAGDVLHLREYDQRDGYTGRSLYREVTYLFDLGCPLVGAHGFVVMGLSGLDDDSRIPVTRSEDDA